MIFSKKDTAVNDSQLAGVAEKENQAINTDKVLRISIVAPDNRVLIKGFKAYFRDNETVKIVHTDRKSSTLSGSDPHSANEIDPP